MTKKCKECVYKVSTKCLGTDVPIVRQLAVKGNTFFSKLKSIEPHCLTTMNAADDGSATTGETIVQYF